MSDQSELMSRLRFTAEDLAANQDGELSEAQRTRLQKTQTRLLGIGAASFLGAVFLATFFIFIGQRNQTIVLTAVGVLLTFVNALWVGTVARQWLRLNADLRESRVDTLSGTLERVLRPTRYGQNYIVRVSGNDFSVDKETFKAFTHKEPYHFYRTPHTHTLLSVIQSNHP